MATCSIIIPVHNRAALTNQCLATLLAETLTSIDVEIVVVDDASTDGTSQVLAGYGNRIIVVSHDVNTGFADACNDGAAAASGEYLVFLNNDTLPQPGWLEALVDYAEAHPKAAVVGSKMLFPDDTIQHAGVVVCQDGYPRHLYAGFPGDHPAANKSRRFQIVTAGCALVRAELFEELGGFDPAFKNGYEDVDFCLRLGELDWEVHYCHESVLYHLESASRDRSSKTIEHNNRLYRSRWADKVKRDDIDYYVEDGLLRITYSELFPMELMISPLVGVVAGSEREREADRLLNVRARQVFDLLRENIRLNLLAEDARLEAGSSAASDVLPGSAIAALGGAAPELVCRGDVHWMADAPTERLISLILPVKNAAERLRKLLPRILEQRTRDSIEIVAVDSGSVDDSVDVLREEGATVLAIEAHSFNHGLTRNLAVEYARGDVIVFLNQNALPANDAWLASLVAPLDQDAGIAGVCSRIVPPASADPLTKKDGLRDPSGSGERSVRWIRDRGEYATLSPHRLRLFINFHTVSAAIRTEVFTRIPFREVVIGEDLVWAKEVLEAGFKIQHEPSSQVVHGHAYSYLDVLRRNVDDGIANRETVGRRLTEDEVLPLISALVDDDWHYLQQECSLNDAELEHWRLRSMVRRTAQVVGQWIGVNGERLPEDVLSFLSLTQQIKAGGTQSSPGALVA